VLGATAVAASASEMASWSAWPLLTVKTREAAKALPMIRHIPTFEGLHRDIKILKSFIYKIVFRSIRF